MTAKIINGKRYDTDTAKQVAAYGEGYSNDFNYFSERLYKKRTGELFLHGEGGALSRYSKTFNGQSTGGEKILPLSIEQAKEWAENDDVSADTYESIFGKVEE